MLNTVQKTALLYVVKIMIHFFLNNPLSPSVCPSRSICPFLWQSIRPFVFIPVDHRHPHDQSSWSKLTNSSAFTPFLPHSPFFLVSISGLSPLNPALAAAAALWHNQNPNPWFHPHHHSAAAAAAAVNSHSAAAAAAANSAALHSYYQSLIERELLLSLTYVATYKDCQWTTNFHLLMTNFSLCF